MTNTGDRVMPRADIVFNEKGDYYWNDDGEQPYQSLSPAKIAKHDWYVANVYIPPEIDYSTQSTKTQLNALLSKPNELIPLKPLSLEKVNYWIEFHKERSNETE